ncbi:MAG: hypothetical protein R2828_35785 [Saprospiraceae bacterium]
MKLPKTKNTISQSLHLFPSGTTQAAISPQPSGIVAFALRKWGLHDGTKQPTGLIHFSREAAENPLKTKHCMSQTHTKPEKQQSLTPNKTSRKPTPKASLFGLGFSVASAR